MQNAPIYESAPLQLQPMIGSMSGLVFNFLKRFKYLLSFKLFGFYFLIDANQSPEYGFGFCGYCLIGISYILVALTFPLSICCCMKVKQGEKAIFN